MHWVELWKFYNIFLKTPFQYNSMSKQLHYTYKKFILLAVLKKKEKGFNSLFKEL
jgi:hypothetical protein